MIGAVKVEGSRGRSAVFVLTSLGLWIQGIWQMGSSFVLGLGSITMAQFENFPFDGGRLLVLTAAALLYSAVVLRAAVIVWELRRSALVVASRRMVLFTVALGNVLIVVYAVYRIAAGGDIAFFAIGCLGGGLNLAGCLLAVWWRRDRSMIASVESTQ